MNEQERTALAIEKALLKQREDLEGQLREVNDKLDTIPTVGTYWMEGQFSISVAALSEEAAKEKVEALLAEVVDDFHIEGDYE